MTMEGAAAKAIVTRGGHAAEPPPAANAPLSPSQVQRIRDVRAGARVVRLSDGWIGVEPFGGERAMIAPERWAALRAVAPDLPAPERLPRLRSAEWLPRSAAPSSAAPAAARGLGRAARR